MSATAGFMMDWCNPCWTAKRSSSGGSKEKKTHKAERKQQKANARQPASEEGGRVYVLDFLGDLRATAVNALREEISIVLAMADEKDEIILRLESLAGLSMLTDWRHPSSCAFVTPHSVNGLRRQSRRKWWLYDGLCWHAYSGGTVRRGWLIGVVAQLPNFNRLLKRHDIDFELLTAGEHKRTLTLFGENTDEGRRNLPRNWKIRMPCSKISLLAIDLWSMSMQYQPGRYGMAKGPWKIGLSMPWRPAIAICSGVWTKRMSTKVDSLRKRN